MLNQPEPLAGGGAATGSPSDQTRAPQVLVAGNPNAGKTTVFNLLTGLLAKVGNYPGVTVDRRQGHMTLTDGRRVEVVDLPGTYSISARSREEQVAVDALLGRGIAAPDLVVLVVDATTLARNLYFAVQVLEAGIPAVIALSMTDEAARQGIEIDVERLASELGTDVVPMVASRGKGRETLVAAIARRLGEPGATEDRDPCAPQPGGAPVGRRRSSRRDALVISYGDQLATDLADVERIVAENMAVAERPTQRAWAIWALLSLDEDDELVDVPAPLRAIVASVRQRAEAAGRQLDEELIGARYQRIDEIVRVAVHFPAEGKPRLTDRIDAVLTHRLWGAVVFGVVMLALFESMFTWSEPAIAAIERVIAGTQQLLIATFADGPLRGLLVDGIVAGVGNVIVFIPQIALLFFLIGFLEDTGYLARVAFVMDRLMGSVGLHGKAFVPMLSGFACAVPAVMATRTIENRRDRLITMLVLPLISCSARLPVYVLVTATIFDPGRQVFGLLTTGAVVLFSMYLLSVVAAVLTAAVLRRTVLRGKRPTLVLELPPYRLPVARNLLATTWQRVRSFLIDAGTIILAMTVVIWALLSYPHSEEVESRYAGLRAEAAQLDDPDALAAHMAELDDHEAADALRSSFAGRIGTFLEPALEPLGLDWRIGIGLVGAFTAREVFVSTLGIVLGIGDADEESRPLRAALADAKRDDGSPLMTPLSGIALMVFFVLACQCMSTIAIVRRESGSWKWALFMFGYMTALAYGAALLVYQVGTLLGLGGSG